MGFGQAISSGFSKYAVWRGRSSRSEFWFWILFTFVVSVVTNALDRIFGFRVYDVGDADGYAVVYNTFGWLSLLAGLVLILPTISVSVRRLHDTNHSGWWWWLQLLNFLCFLGTIILIFAFYIKPSDPGDNSYGPPPAA